MNLHLGVCDKHYIQKSFQKFSLQCRLIFFENFLRSRKFTFEAKHESNNEAIKTCRTNNPQNPEESRQEFKVKVSETWKVRTITNRKDFPWENFCIHEEKLQQRKQQKFFQKTQN